MQKLFEKLLKLQYPTFINQEVVKLAVKNGKITSDGYLRITGEEYVEE